MKRRKPKQSIDEEKRKQIKTSAKEWVTAAAHNELLDRFARDFVDLVESDDPLSPEVRKYIADELRRFNASPFYSMRRRFADRFADEQIFLTWVLKMQLRDCGLTSTAAEEDVAEVLGISVDAVRKRFQRHGDIHRWRGAYNLFGVLMRCVYSGRLYSQRRRRLSRIV